MRTVMFAVAAATAWSVLFYKLLVLRRDNNPFLRSYCATAALMATAFTIGMPPVISRWERATGVLAAWDTCVIVIACASIQTTALLWTYPAEDARRRIRPLWWLYGLAATAMLALDLIGRVPPDTVALGAAAEAPERVYGQTPYVADAMLIYIALLAYTTISTTFLFWRYAGLVDRRWLRRCLKLLAATAVINTAGCGAVATFVIGLRFGVDLEAAQRVYTVLGGVGVLVGAVAAALPTLGPRLDRLVACHRLHPLWLALYRANPDIVLDPPRLVRVDRWTPWNVDFRLYRRIIEIRDSRLALRPHMDPVLATRIRSRVKQSGTADHDLDATVEAVILAAAIDAKLSGAPPVTGEAAPVEHPNRGSDLAAETAWFVRVARAFVRLTATDVDKIQSSVSMIQPSSLL